MPPPAENSPAGAADALERERATAQALEKEAELAGGGQAAASLLLALADVRDTRLGDAEGALSALEKARAAAPDDSAVLAALRRLALRLWRWPLAADVLAVERKHKNGAERISAGLQLADVLADHLNRRDEALAILLEILEAEPANAPALSRALPMWMASGAWSEQAESLIAAAGAVRDADPRRAAALLYEAAEVWRWRLHAPERAAEALLEAIAVDPKSGAAAKSLAEIAAELRDWRALATALEVEAALAARPELAAAALAKVGSLREDLLGDAEGAEKAYRAALEREPKNRAAMVALSRIAEAKGDHALRAELLERRLILATDVREAIAISLALGSLYEEQLKSPDRAANHFQRVLAVTADEAPAFRALGRLMASTSDWRGLLALYEREATESPDPTHKVHCLFKIAELFEERLGEDGSAIAAYRRVLELSPTYLPALRALGRLFSRAQDWKSLAELYEGEAAATEDKEHAITLLERVADLQEEKLGDPAAAAASWEKILTLVPDHLPALRELGRLHFRREAWDALVAVNLREAALTRDTRVVAALLQKTGEVYEERLHSPEDALRCYREALDHLPNYLPAMRSLGRLAAARGAWDEVVRTEEMEAEGTADPRRAASLFNSAAEHYETKLNDNEKAIAAYERVISRVPGYLPAVAGLSRLYRRAGRWSDLVRILEGAIPPMDRDAAAAAAILVEIANVEGHRLGDDAHAALHLATAREGAPSDLTARREHEEYLAKNGQWMELAAIYAASAESDAPGPLRGALYVRLADLARKVADGGSATAAGFYRAALALDHADRAAASGLDSLGRETGDDAMRVEALSAISMCAASLPERRAVMVELARLYERAGDTANAAACWGSVSAIEADVDSLEAQARLAHLTGDVKLVAECRVQSLALAPEGSDRDRMTLEAANALVAAGEWSRAEAILAPLAAAAAEPTPALLALERLYLARAQQDPAGAADALVQGVEIARKLAARTRDPVRKTELTMRAAAALTGPLDRPAEAAKLLEEITATEPAGSEPHQQALTLLQDLYTRSGDPTGQAGILERQAEGAQGEARAALLQQAGDLLRPADPDRAILLWERAVAASPATTGAVLERLIEAYHARANWQPLLTTWNRVIAATRDPHVAADAFFQKGIVLADQLGLPDKAEQHFQRALGASPGHVPALERIAALQQAAGRFDEARASLSKALELTAADDPAREERQLALANLARAAGDEKTALELLQAIAAKNPSRAGVHAQVVELLAKKGDPWGQAQALKNALATAPEAERGPMRKQLAAALDAAKDERGALLEWRAILKAEPDDPEARAAIAAILSRAQATRPEAIAAHGQVLKVDPLNKASLLWLAKTFDEIKAADKVLCLLSLLSWSGAATPEQQQFHAEQLARQRRGVTPLSPEDRRALLVHHDARTQVGDLLGILGSALYAGLPFDVPNGAVKAQAGDKHPVRVRLDALRTMIAGPEVDLHLTREPGAEAKVVAADPMVILVGTGFPALPPPVQDFLLARAAFRVASGWPPTWRSEHEVRADVWTAAAALDFTDPPMGSDPRRIKAIAKAVSRKQKKDASDLLSAWVAKPQSFDVASFVAGSRRSADRAGLLACGDVARSVEALSFVEPELEAIRADESSAQPFWARAAATPVVRELLVFASSEEYFLLRKKLGLAVS